MPEACRCEELTLVGASSIFVGATLPLVGAMLMLVGATLALLVRDRSCQCDASRRRTDKRSELAPIGDSSDRTDKDPRRTDHRQSTPTDYVVDLPRRSSSVRMIASAISFLVFRRWRLWR